MYGNNMSRGTQDWQIDAYEKRGRDNPYIRHQRLVMEMERNVSTWEKNKLTHVFKEAK